MATKKNLTTDRTPAVPTPEMIQAMFATLRQIGWNSGKDMERGQVPCVAATEGKKQAIPTRAQVEAVFALARELGWMNLNDDEKALIIRLRRTTYHGRKVVSEVASAIARDFPWRHGSPYNTTE